MALSQKSYRGIDSEEDLKWEELRSLFVGDERAYLQEIKEMLGDGDKFAREIGKNLPLAFRVGMLKNKELSDQLIESIRPVIERAIAESARDNTEDLSAKLQPIFGPAIRRSINDTFKRMDQSFNSIFLRTFSLRGIKYRIEAWRTGQPFAQVLISKTMNYKVNEVFLIHQETGLLLNHVALRSQTQDGDMMSAMLKAIQDFVTDSFNSDDGDSILGAIEFGGQKIHLEQGRHVVLAAVIYGTLPQFVVDNFRKVILDIEGEYKNDLTDFDGDVEKYEDTNRLLHTCFAEGKREIKEGAGRTPLIISILLFIVFLIYFIPRWIDNYNWSQYLEKVSTLPGVVVIEENKKSDIFHVVGMRRPTSVHPEDFISEFDLDTAQVKSNWLEYRPYSTDDVLKKARKVLRVPDNIMLSLDGDVLIAEGEASQLWVRYAKNKIRDLWEINTIETSNLIQIELENVESVKKRIEDMHILFHLESSSLTADEMDRVQEVVRQLQNLINIAAFSYKNIEIVINGYTDGTGNRDFNKKLSEERAQTVYNFFVANGISSSILTTIGHGFDSESSDGDQNAAQQGLRTVKISIILKDN